MAAVLVTRLASNFGGLLRNGIGKWFSGFAGYIGVSNNLHAELLALQYGFQFAWLILRPTNGISMPLLFKILNTCLRGIGR